MLGKFTSGSYLVTGLIGFTLIFGMVFWWFQQHAFLHETWAEEVVIAGTVYKVTDWQGVEADSSPLKLRACFVVEEEVRAPAAYEAAPLVGPGWFKCFNAQAISEALETEYAKAYVAARDDPYGFDRIVAVFPGGRVYMWRQLNGKISE